MTQLRLIRKNMDFMFRTPDTPSWCLNGSLEDKSLERLRILHMEESRAPCNSV